MLVGSVVELIDCTSSRDQCGCHVSAGATLTAHEVSVNDSQYCGFECNQARMILNRCTAFKCGTCGLLVQGDGAHVEAESFRVHENLVFYLCRRSVYRADEKLQQQAE